MPKKYRLSRIDFVRLSRARSRRVHGTYFSLIVAVLPEGGGPKAACVASKKAAARAVDRNKIERRCREALRSHIARIQKPIAFIFHAKREARAGSSAEIAHDIESLLARAILQGGMA